MLPSGTATVMAASHGWVQSAAPMTNNRHSLELHAGWTDLAAGDMSYVHFDVPDLEPHGCYKKAKLNLYQVAVGQPENYTVKVEMVQASWREDTLNWSNAPSATDAAVTPLDVSNSAGWKTWDVTAVTGRWMAHSQPNYGLRVSGATLADGTRVIGTRIFGSRLSANPPRLSVEWITDWTDPTIPTLSSSHPAGQWRNVAQVTMNWPSATDGDGCGIDGYSYLWSALQYDDPDDTIDTQAKSLTQTLGQGEHWFHLRALDLAGNWSETSHYGPIKIDTVAPTTQINAPAQVTNKTFTVSWSGSDATSRVHHYEVRYRDRTSSPNVWQTWYASTTLTSASFTGQDGHKYVFQARAYDQAGNVRTWGDSPQAEAAVGTVDFIAERPGDHPGRARFDQQRAPGGRQAHLCPVPRRSPSLGTMGRSVRSSTSTATASSSRRSWRATRTATSRCARIRIAASFRTASTSTCLLLAARHDHTGRAHQHSGWAQTNTNNDTATATVSFTAVPPLRVWILDMCYTWNGADHDVPWSDINAITSYLRRMYPISSLIVPGVAILTPCSSAWQTEQQNLDTLAIFRESWALDGSVTRPWERVYGVFSNDYATANWGCAGGLSYVPSTIAVGPTGPTPGCYSAADQDGVWGDEIAAHELGHALDRPHAPSVDSELPFCYGQEPGRDQYWPTDHTQGNISPTTDPMSFSAIYGFDIETLQVYPPTWKDVMTYCSPVWISDYTYKKIRQRLLDEGEWQAQAAQRGAPQDYLVVSGKIVTGTQQVQLGDFYHLMAAAEPSGRVPGEYSIRLLGAGGVTLADYPFTPQFNYIDYPSPGSGPAAALISEAVRWDHTHNPRRHLPRRD